MWLEICAASTFISLCAV